MTMMMWRVAFGTPYKKPWSGADYERYITGVFTQMELDEEWRGLQMILYRNLHPDLN